MDETRRTNDESTANATGDAGGLRVEGLAKSFGDGREKRAILHDLAFTLNRGETLAVVGPSGSGKSTLLNLLGALDTPDAGSIRLGNRAIESLSDPERAAFRNREVGFVFQDHLLLPECTALENVLIPDLAEANTTRHDERARRLLERVGLAQRMEDFPASLSGGERQRVAVARALLHAPALLLCDEPTGNLDRAAADAVGDLLAGAAEEGAMVIVATHDLAFAERFGTLLALRGGALHPPGEEDGRSRDDV